MFIQAILVVLLLGRRSPSSAPRLYVQGRIDEFNRYREGHRAHNEAVGPQLLFP